MSATGLTFAHNSIVITGRGRPRVIADPMPQPSPDSYYWAGAARVHGTQIWEIAERIIQTGPGLWDLQYAGDYLAKINTTDWRLASITPLAGTTGQINWGVAMLDHGPYTYIYGTETQGSQAGCTSHASPKAASTSRGATTPAPAGRQRRRRLTPTARRRRPRVLRHRPQRRPRDQGHLAAPDGGTGDLLLARREPSRPVHHQTHDLQHGQLRRTDLHLQHARAPRTGHRRADAVLIQRQQLRPAHTRQRHPLPPTIFRIPISQL